MTVRAALLASALLAVVAAGCEKESIAVASGPPEADYHRAELLAAIDAFVAAGRTAEAYGVLGRTVAALRGGMDETVAEEAELKLVVLAVSPVEAAGNLPIDVQTQVLGTTVWPIALGPDIKADAPGRPGDPRRREVAVRPGEDAASYVVRMCGGPLAVECKDEVPEYQGHVLGVRAIRRMTQRAREAVGRCLGCAGDPQWADAVRRWEALDRKAIARVRSHERVGASTRWPTAGPAARPWSGSPVLDVDDDGTMTLGGTPVGTERVKALAAARTGTVLGVHVVPTARVDVMCGIAEDAAAAGYKEIALEARVGMFPWELREYRFPVPARGRGHDGAHQPHDLPVRDSDTIQVLLRTVDAMAKR